MDTAISVQIAGLSAMNKAELLSIWAKNFREAPPCIAAEESDGFHPLPTESRSGSTAA